MIIIHEFSVNDELEDTNENLRLKANEDNHDRYTKKKTRKENASDIEENKLV